MTESTFSTRKDLLVHVRGYNNHLKKQMINLKISNARLITALKDKTGKTYIRNKRTRNRSNSNMRGLNKKEIITLYRKNNWSQKHLKTRVNNKLRFKKKDAFYKAYNEDRKLAPGSLQKLALKEQIKRVHPKTKKIKRKYNKSANIKKLTNKDIINEYKKNNWPLRELKQYKNNKLIYKKHFTMKNIYFKRLHPELQ